MKQTTLSAEELLVLQDTRPLTREEIRICGRYLTQKYDDEVQRLEDELVKFGLRYEYSFDIGSYGNGRSLIVEEGHWSGKEKGAWLSSSESC
jgi:hypothetical protein